MLSILKLPTRLATPASPAAIKVAHVANQQTRLKSTLSNKSIHKSIQSYIPKQGNISKNWLKRFGRVHRKALEAEQHVKKPYMEHVKLLKKLQIGTQTPLTDVKEVAFARNLLHLNWSRFIFYTHALRNTTLEEAVLQARWQQRRTGRMMESLLWQAWHKAASLWNLSPEDIDRIVVKSVVVSKSPLVSKRLVLKGRGPYGATPHPKNSLVVVKLALASDAAERDTLLARRFTKNGVVDPDVVKKEQLKMRLREWMKTEQEVEAGRVLVPTDYVLTVDGSKKNRAKALPQPRDIIIYN